MTSGALLTLPTFCAAIDTFAVVCPREPTEAMEVDADFEILGRATNEDVRDALRAGIAASPFAPERGGGNEQAG